MIFLRFLSTGAALAVALATSLGGCTNGEPAAGSSVASAGGGGASGGNAGTGGGSGAGGTDTGGSGGTGGALGPPDPQPPCECAGVSFVDVGLGDDHACALSDDGRVFCWGSGHLGQVGAVDTATICSDSVMNICGWESGPPPQTFDLEWPCPTDPIEVELPSAATALSVGPAHVCSVLKGESTACWGIGFGNSRCVVGVRPSTGGINCDMSAEI